MSKKIVAMSRVIEFAKANGFPGAYAVFWDEDGEPLEDEYGIDEYWLDPGAVVPIRLAVSLDGLDPDDTHGRVFAVGRCDDEDEDRRKVIRDEMPEETKEKQDGT